MYREAKMMTYMINLQDQFAVSSLSILMTTILKQSISLSLIGSRESMLITTIKTQMEKDLSFWVRVCSSVLQ